MTDRDHFAAAALAGLLAQGDDGSFSEESYARGAYRWADALLRVRDSRTADKPNLDAAPAARADADSARTDKAALRPGEGTGDTPTLTDAEREAVDMAIDLLNGVEDVSAGASSRADAAAATLRGLLERTGAANSGDDRRSGGGE